MKLSSKRIRQFYDRFHRRQESKVVDFMTKNRHCFLKSRLTYQKGKVLLVGCGSGDEMSILAKNHQAVGMDISPVAIYKSKKKYPHFKYVLGDAQKMPFKKSEFDCLVCSEVIEHLADEAKFLKEAHRVLKPKGRLILTTPNWFSWYGLARKIGESLFKRPFTSAEQPIDHWYTYWSLRKKTKAYFLKDWCGLWFFPPFGRGKYLLSDSITYPLVRIFHPFNIFLRRKVPWFGHLLFFDLLKKGKK